MKKPIYMPIVREATNILLRDCRLNIELIDLCIWLRHYDYHI